MSVCLTAELSRTRGAFPLNCEDILESNIVVAMSHSDESQISNSRLDRPVQGKDTTECCQATAEYDGLLNPSLYLLKESKVGSSTQKIKG